jgi:hypothetical protein
MIFNASSLVIVHPSLCQAYQGNGRSVKRFAKICELFRPVCGDGKNKGGILYEKAAGRGADAVHADAVRGG